MIDAREVALEEIHPSPNNARRELGDLSELAASIHAVGILQPLLVVPNDDGFELVAGHRRLAAARLAGLMIAPVVVRERIGRNQGHISKRLALLKLPARAREAIDAGELTIELGLELAAAAQEDRGVATEIAEVFAEKLDERWPGRWELEGILRDHEHRRARIKRLEELKASGIRVLAKAPRGAVALSRHGPLSHVNHKTHEAQPCHVVVMEDYFDHLMCTEPSNHPAPKQKEKTKVRKIDAEIDAEIQSLAEAAERRRGFLVSLFGAKRAPKGMLELICRQLLIAEQVYPDVNVVSEILGFDRRGTRSQQVDALAGWVGGDQGRQQRAAAAAICSDIEADIETPMWPWPSEADAYFAWLTLNGYEPSEAETAELARGSSGDR